MEYSVSIYVEGDREIQLEEVVQLADAVAAHNGVASLLRILVARRSGQAEEKMW